MRKPPATPAELEQAAAMLEDGSSYREVKRTLGISVTTLRNHFPGAGWTYREGGEFRWIMRKARVIV